MRGVRRRDTVPEVNLRRELHRRGYRYRLQYPVPGRPRRRVDVVFPRLRIAVEIRGCYWHGCPEHGGTPKVNADWWRQKIARNQARDADTEQALAEAGWAVIVVWEHEDVLAAADRVAGVVHSRLALI